MNKVVSVTVLGILIAFLAFSAHADSDKKLFPLRLGLDSAVGGSLQFRIAKEKGFFARRGIDASSFNFPFGIDTINALLVERVDTAFAADYALVNALVRGDFVVVSVLSRTTEATRGDFVLFARNNIRKPADLIGKKLGVAKGTVLEYVWVKYLEKNGIDPSKVTFVPYSSADESAVGVKRGDIDALWQLGALVDKFKSFPDIRVFADVLDSGHKVTAYLLFQRAFVKKHPDIVTQVILAAKEGTDYLLTHKEETAALAFKELKLPQDAVLRDLERRNFSLGFTKADYTTLIDIKRYLEKNGLLKGSYDLKDKFILDPLRRALPESVTYDPSRS